MMGGRPYHLGLLGAGLALGLGIATAGAAERIRVRAWAHPDFGRIVFDWPAETGYQAKLDGRVLTIRFASPFTATFGRIAANLGSYVATSELLPDGRTARFRLTGDFMLSTARYGSSVALDLKSAAPIQAGSGAAVPVRFGDHDRFSRAVFDFPAVVPYSVAAGEGQVTVRFERAAELDLTRFANADPRFLGRPKVRRADATTIVEFAIPAGARVTHFRDGPRIAIDITVLESAPKSAPK